jgi:hypothetical protein
LFAFTTPRGVLALNYSTNGGEYAISGNLPGDQVHPQVALGANGGYLVWEDNTIDGDGLGISAIQLGRSLSGSLSPFRVNSIGAADQEKPQVSLLQEGGAVFVWQGGPLGHQHIFARFLSANNTWLNSDVQVNSFNQSFQANPGVATLANGNVVVVWSSYNQQSSNSMHDIYGQLFSPAGDKIGSEFSVNQFTTYNQRTPAVAALSGGGFVVTWVSEQQRVVATNPGTSVPVAQIVPPSVDIYGRLYTADAQPSASEFVLNTNLNTCANPAVVGGADGGFVATWGQMDTEVAAYSWDVLSRTFSSTGVGGPTRVVNTRREGDQFGAKVSTFGSDYLVVWTGLAQDGSQEGVFGQFLSADGSPSGNEFQVNTTWLGKQMHPAVAADGNGQFLVTWTSFGVGINSFDLYAQRYASVGQPLLAMAAPFVHVPFVLNNGVYQPQLLVSWPIQAGLSVDHYELYLDGASTPVASTATNIWVLGGLTTSSTHSVQVAYVTSDGRRSPLSAAASATTWSGFTWGGIPFEWMTSYYGSDTSLWPRASTDLAANGPTLLDVFLSGGNPLVPNSWLRTQLAASPQGFFLSWNPQPGLLYQVQASADLSSWTNLGGPRFAAGSQDSINVGQNQAGYYRVLRLR